MKKLLIVLLFLNFTVFGQVTPVKNVRVANATTSFGENISKGDNVYNLATGEKFVAKEAIYKDSTLTQEQIRTLI